MLLLAFDTATPAVTVALHDGARVLAQESSTGARRHGELLAPSIANVLAAAAAVPGDLTGIAPALLITCALDLLQEEGRVYAGRLAAAGALREHHDLPGAEHNYNQVSRDRALVERGYALIAKHVIAAAEV